MMGYVLSVRENDHWTSYTVTSAMGGSKVRAWIEAHSEQLQKSAEYAPQLAYEPGWLLRLDTGDGRIQEFDLVTKYPIDSRPKAEAIYVQNFSELELEGLLKMFVEFGHPTGEVPYPVSAPRAEDEGCQEEEADP